MPLKRIFEYPRPAAAALALTVAWSSLSASAHDPVQHEGHAAAAAPTATAPADEASFVAENDAAMDKMMKDMMVKPTGDVDRDFVAMMVPHHQGAIDMAVAVLKYGRNEQLKRLAQEIIVTQQQEIAAMWLAIGEPLPPSAPAPTQASAGVGSGQQ